MEGSLLDRVIMRLTHASNLNDLTKDNPNGKSLWLKLRRLLRHAEVTTSYTQPPRKYKVQDIVLAGSNFEFEHAEDGVITVAVTRFNLILSAPFHLTY